MNSVLAHLREKTPEDQVMQAVLHPILNGWPDNKAQWPVEVTHFFSFRKEVVVGDGFVFKGHG